MEGSKFAFRADRAFQDGEFDFVSKLIDKAKAVDPSVEELARTKINTFSQYFPLKETTFFYDLAEGDSYTVGCWINETTKVRTSD